jgi:mannosyltransferase OCH1-like enzyme
MIPKIIHYCWVGPRPMSELGRRCVESWKRHLPDYELRLWNEQNSPMEHRFMKLMYETGRYGFVPDYLRFWALEKFGGVYLDCDVELLGSLDPYLGEAMFLSFMCTQNRIRKNPPATALIGARGGHPLLREILEVYDRLNTARMSNSVVWDLLLKRGLKKRGERKTRFESVTLGDVKIYHADRFHPVEQGEAGKLRAVAKPGSVAVHHGLGDWGGPMEERTWWRKFLDWRPDRKLLRPVEAWLRRLRRKGAV